VRLVAGKPSEADDAYQRSLDIIKKLADDDPGNAKRQRDLGVSLNRIGDVRVAAGKPSAAGNTYQRSLDIIKKLADDDPDNAKLSARSSRFASLRWRNVAMTPNDTSPRRSRYSGGLRRIQRLPPTE